MEENIGYLQGIERTRISRISRIFHSELIFEHESHESHESFVLKQLIRLIRAIRVPKKNA